MYDNFEVEFAIKGERIFKIGAGCKCIKWHRLNEYERFCDVHLDNGSITRVFNPDIVNFKRKDCDCEDRA